MKQLIVALGLAAFTLNTAITFAQNGFQKPPQEIVDIIDQPSTPGISISPDNSRIVFLEHPGLPLLKDIAIEDLRLAGIRIDPLNHATVRSHFNTNIRITNIEGTNELKAQNLPENPRLHNFNWSADGRYLAFLHTTGMGVELWVMNAHSGNTRKLGKHNVNAVIGNAYSWHPDNESIIYKAVPQNIGTQPQKPTVANAPIIQENIGRKAAVRTFQDMLQDEHDEALFEHFTLSQLVRVQLSGEEEMIGEPDQNWTFSVAPGGNYVLRNVIQKPYSYIVPFTRFSQRMEVTDMSGSPVFTLFDIPVSDDLPQGFGAVRTGPRSAQWRNDTDATLVWVEALDEGDPSLSVDYRDQLFFLDAPFNQDPIAGFKLQLRYGGIHWGDDDLAMVYESWRRTRRIITSRFSPEKPAEKPSVVFDRSYEDRYNDPGRFQTYTDERGQSRLLTDRRGRKLYLIGQGASPEGDRPFLDEYDIRRARTERLWQSESPYFENPIKIIDADRPRIISRRESKDTHPNFFLRDLRRNTLAQITKLPDPFEGLRDVRSMVIQYEREDGIPLDGRLYLPPNYNLERDGSLPTILWAYPREFLSADAAGQVSGSPYTYTRIGSTSPVFLATQGYAVLNNASFPIVGGEDEEPNDTFVEQLVANAEAAINKLEELGYTDPDRVAVAGHSYGAFMTANLLAHSDLFAAGIARSGAFNRSLTPFGFQAEERTYWDAPDVYHLMSPFSFAHEIDTPLLIIHGTDDNNSGTFPMQSERLYDALRGHGATVRLVMLPHEGHGYRARESVLHMHWEWLQWLDEFVKNK